MANHNPVGGNKNSGRKPLAVENSVIEMYKSFIPKVLIIIDQSLNSKNKLDRKWGVEMASRGLVKMVPQIVQGDVDNPVPISIDLKGVSIDTIIDLLNKKLGN